MLNEQSTDVKLSISQASWFASITAIFSPIGGLLSGYMLDKFGRRTTLICINLISIISWLIIGYSSKTDVNILFAQLMVARIIIGKHRRMCPLPKAIIDHNKNQTKLIFYFDLIHIQTSGVAVGMSSSPAAVYAAEISHPMLRGRLTLLSALCTAIGMLLIYLLGYLIPVRLKGVSKDENKISDK